MTRLLARLLVFLLAPVVMIAGTQVRASADTYGTVAVQAKIGDITKSTFGWECNVVGYWVLSADAPYVQTDWFCGVGWYQDDTYLRAAWVQGPSCELRNNTLDVNIDEDEQRDFELPLSVGEHDCGVTEICVEYQTDDAISGLGDLKEKCEPFALGLPPEDEPTGDPAGCPLATAGSTPTWEGQADGGTVNVPGSGNGYRISANPTATVSGVDSFWIRGVFRSRDAALSGYPLGTIQARRSPSSTATNSVTPTSVGSPTSVQATSFTAAAATSGWELIGVQLWVADNTLTGSRTAPEYYDDIAGPNLGITNGPNCQWYWGEDFRGDPPVDDYIPVGPGGGDPVGDPGGGLPTEPPDYEPPEDPEDPDGDGPGTGPVDSEDACGDFKLTDPGTWVDAGFCSLVQVLVEALKVLGDILTALGDLAETIATAIIDGITGLLTAILDGLAALFIPDPDLLQGHIDGLQDLFHDSPAGGWTDGIGGGIGGTPSSACAGPSVEGFSIMGAEVEAMQPFNACGDNGTAAALVRSVMTVVIAISGGLLMLRMVLSSLGIRTTAPSGAGGQQ